MNSGTQDLPESGAGTQHSPANSVVRFGAFEVNLSTGELRKDGARVRLQGKPFQILQALLERPGEVVTRDELRKRLWPADFVDFESGLNTAANRLRLTLGDSAENPRYIQTLARNGYRFIAPVAEVCAPPDFDVVTQTTPQSEIAQAAVDARNTTRWIWAFVVGALTLVGGSSAIYFGHIRTKREPSFRQMTFRRGYVDAARFAPDGQTVLYAAKWSTGVPSDWTISMVSSASPESRSLDFTGYDLMSVSRSGELLLTKEHSLYRVPMNGGRPRLFLEGVYCADWLPQGEISIVRLHDSLSRVEFPRGKPVFQTAGYITDLRASANGDAIAFLEHPMSSDDGGNVIWVESKGTVHHVSEGWASVGGLAWSPDGREIWFTASRTGVNRALYAVTRSGQQRLVHGTPGILTLHDISPEGRILLSRDNLREVMLRGSTSDSSSDGLDISWFDWSEPEEISPDGKRLLFIEGGEGGGREYAVYVRDLSSDAPTKISDGEAFAFFPDGRSVVTMLPRENDRLTIMPLAAGMPRTVVGPKGFAYQWVQVFPDGRNLLVSGNMPGEGIRLYTQSAEGGPLTPLKPEVSLEQPKISPSGREIAGNTRAHTVAIVPASGGTPVVLPIDPPAFPVKWNADDVRLLVNTVGKSGEVVLQWFDTRTGKLTPWRTVKAPQGEISGVHHVVLSPDERTYVYSAKRRLSELFLVDGWS
jgi:DNA-binding winged helix-turn-helix (wHTH) protein